MGLTRAVRLTAITILCSSSSITGQEVSEQRVRAAIDDAARGLGQGIAGGSAITGGAGTTGGLGHFHVGTSFTVTRVEVEDPRRPQGELDFFLPSGTVHGALGVTGGGSSDFGAIDIIGRLGPLVAREDYRESRMLVAVGARLGILREGALVPAISATLSRSWVDRLEYGDPDGDQVSFATDVHVTSARLEVSKEFLLLTPYLGVGLHRAGIDADYRIPASRSTGDREIVGSLESSDSHSVTYAGVEFALALLIASAEIGVYDGGALAAVAFRAGF